VEGKIVIQLAFFGKSLGNTEVKWVLDKITTVKVAVPEKITN